MGVFAIIRVGSVRGHGESYPIYTIDNADFWELKPKHPMFADREMAVKYVDDNDLDSTHQIVEFDLV